jgi:hypothetical protein
MPDIAGTSSRRVLDPIERVSEVLFGLIMVLTFTSSLSVAESGREDVHSMVVGAVGCNIAWGIIDAVLFLMGSLAEKGRSLLAFRSLRASEPQEAREILASALPPMVASVLETSELESMRLRLQQLPEPPEHARLGYEDWLGALGVFLLVFLSIFPVAMPFLLMSEGMAALRVSNAVAIAMLFVMGYAFGRMTGRQPLSVGIAMVVLGVILVGMTIVLGG